MQDHDPALPKQSRWLCRWFSRYCAKYIRKHFHAVRQSLRSQALPSDGLPVILVMNHPSWWDVIVGFNIARAMPKYKHYGPIESAMLEKYRFFAKLGLFGVDRTARGAAIFLRTSKAILNQEYSALWITAQGRFVDPRERPIELMSGLGAIASRLERGYVVPIAVEYPFWTESTAEVLYQIGQPISIAEQQRSSAQWTELVTEKLTQLMDELATDAISRDPGRFTVIAAGKSGIGGVYDWWRAVRAKLTGRPIDLGHHAGIPNQSGKVGSS